MAKRTPIKKTKTVKVNCAGCSLCCEFLVVRVKPPKPNIKVNKICVKGRKNNYVIVGDRRPFDFNFFKYHNVKVTASKEIMLYELPPSVKPTYKIVDGEYWFNVPIRCKKLAIRGKFCKIYNRRPECCKVSDCILLEEDKGDVYIKDWNKL